jgi:2-dehydro-3-deoxyphosphogluconate aldolase/(4S)-4-hydroxy-2-oxoglutarate aldolase
VREWFSAGAAAVGVESAVTKAWHPDGDFTRVVTAAKGFLATIQGARQ